MDKVRREERNCTICGETFTVVLGKGGRSKYRQYCSRKCKQLAYRRRLQQTGGKGGGRGGV